MRIAICTNFVSPYRRPVFGAMAATPGVEVGVFTSTGMEADRDWSTVDGRSEPFRIIRSLSITRRRTTRSSGGGGFIQQLERHYPVGMPWDIARFRPDVIISGELGPRTMMAWATGKVMGVPVVPWTYHPEAQADVAARGTVIRRAILRSCPAVIGMGTQARHVLRSMGCDDAKIFDALNAADTSGIDARVNTFAHAESVSRIRRSLQGKRIALVCGRLVPMKGIDELLSAWSRVNEATRREWELVFVGDGSLSDRVDAMKQHGVTGVGHVDPALIPDWYAAADLHIFASLGDPWGLVVNEAMRCGTPTLCSRWAGCANDLVIHDRNGIVFDPSKTVDQVAADLQAALSRTDLDAMGQTAILDVAHLTPEAMARSMLNAAECAVWGWTPGQKEVTA